jgi:HEAT repeat protein
VSTIARRALLGAAALLALSAIVFLWSGDPDDSSAPSTSAARLQWRAGYSQQYDVRIDSSMRMNTDEPGSVPTLSVRMSAVLDLLTLETDAATTWVGMRLSAVELTVGGTSDATTERALAEPFRVRYSTTGMPETFEFPGTVAAQQRLILENLVRTYQVTMQAGEEWSAAETNAAGTYEAAYRRTPSGIDKTKRNFVGHATAPTYLGAEVTSAETFAVDSQLDWLAAMTVDETVKTAGRGGPALEITNRATLSLRPAVGAAAAPEMWSFVAAPALAQTPGTAGPTSLSVEEARAQIRAEVAALDDAVEGRMPRVHRLRDLLRVDGALPAALLDLLRTQPLTDRTRADLYLALELADTEPAQAALTSVIGNPASPLTDGMRAIVALAGVAHPTGPTVAALWNTALNAPATDDGTQLASTATFALGSVGNAMRENDDPGYSSLRARLLGGAVGGAGTDVQRANYVHAVGNTRDATLASEIIVLLDDPAPEVRRAAALSLGRLDADRAAADLVEQFERERDSRVRGAIAESLVSWSAPDAESMEMVRDDVRAEVDENTRFNMARFLAANLTAFPENRAVLEDLLRAEQSQRIRQSVAEALAAPPAAVTDAGSVAP